MTVDEAPPPLSPAPEAPRRLPQGAVATLCVLGSLGVWAALIAAWRPASGARSEESVQKTIVQDGWAFGTLIFLKFVPAFVGLVLLILYAGRRAAVRRGQLPPPPPRPAPRVPLPLPAAIGMLILYIAAASGVAQWAMHRWSDPAIRLVAFSAPGVLFAIVVVVLRAQARPGGAALSVRARLLAAGRVFCASAAIVLAAAIVGQLVLRGVFGMEGQAQTLVETALEEPGPAYLWALGIIGAIVAPVVEESMFRGLLYPAVRERAGPTIAAFATAIPFAAIHEFSPHTFLPLLALALLLAGLFEATDSLLAVVAVHVLNNATSLVPLLIAA
jgi:membrane protease YdiL (CAAX protease family)